MTDHEKRIREALEALPAIAEWSSDELGVWMVDDPFDTFVCAAEDVEEAAFIAACNPSAIRALLADLDAMRGALKSVQAAIYMDDAGQLRLTRSFDESTIDAALKGASA